MCKKSCLIIYAYIKNIVSIDIKTEDNIAIRKQKVIHGRKLKDETHDLSASCQPRRHFRQGCDKLTAK